MKVIVLMQNDFPVGVYSDERQASKAAVDHYGRHYQGNFANMKMRDYNYRQYEFIVDAKAK